MFGVGENYEKVDNNYLFVTILCNYDFWAI